MCHKVVIVERRSAEIRLTFALHVAHFALRDICLCDSDNLVLLRSLQSSGHGI